MAFGKKPAPPSALVSLVICGLGNPGGQYSGTRHNLGFRCIDELATRLGARVTAKQENALIGLATHPGRSGESVLLVKPQTYMNLSGRAIAPLLRRYRVSPEALWVVHDEMDIPFGKLRIREGGGHGGHNGIRSLIADLGTPAFPRFRLGVGRPPEGADSAEYLLQDFDPRERPLVGALIELGADAVMDALKDGLLISMNRFNGRMADA